MVNDNPLDVLNETLRIQHLRVGNLDADVASHVGYVRTELARTRIPSDREGFRSHYRIGDLNLEHEGDRAVYQSEVRSRWQRAYDNRVRALRTAIDYINEHGSDNLPQDIQQLVDASRAYNTEEQNIASARGTLEGLQASGAPPGEVNNARLDLIAPLVSGTTLNNFRAAVRGVLRLHPTPPATDRGSSIPEAHSEATPSRSELEQSLASLLVGVQPGGVPAGTPQPATSAVGYTYRLGDENAYGQRPLILQRVDRENRAVDLGEVERGTPLYRRVTQFSAGQVFTAAQLNEVADRERAAHERRHNQPTPPQFVGAQPGGGGVPSRSFVWVMQGNQNSSGPSYGLVEVFTSPPPVREGRHVSLVTGTANSGRPALYAELGNITWFQPGTQPPAGSNALVVGNNETGSRSAFINANGLPQMLTQQERNALTGGREGVVIGGNAPATTLPRRRRPSEEGYEHGGYQVGFSGGNANGGAPASAAPSYNAGNGQITLPATTSSVTFTRNGGNINLNISYRSERGLQQTSLNLTPEQLAAASYVGGGGQVLGGITFAAQGNVGNLNAGNTSGLRDVRFNSSLFTNGNQVSFTGHENEYSQATGRAVIGQARHQARVDIARTSITGTPSAGTGTGTAPGGNANTRVAQLTQEAAQVMAAGNQYSMLARHYAYGGNQRAAQICHGMTNYCRARYEQYVGMIAAANLIGQGIDVGNAGPGSQATPHGAQPLVHRAPLI